MVWNAAMLLRDALMVAVIKHVHTVRLRKRVQSVLSLVYNITCVVRSGAAD